MSPHLQCQYSMCNHSSAIHVYRAGLWEMVLATASSGTLGSAVSTQPSTLHTSFTLRFAPTQWLSSGPAPDIDHVPLCSRSLSTFPFLSAATYLCYAPKAPETAGVSCLVPVCLVLYKACKNDCEQVQYPKIYSPPTSTSDVRRLPSIRRRHAHY